MGSDKSNHRFSPKFLTSKILSRNTAEKILLFLKTQLSLDDVFGLWRQKHLDEPVCGSNMRRHASCVFQIRMKCHHCELMMQSKRCQASSFGNWTQTTFRGFSRGIGTQYQRLCPWPAVCNVIHFERRHGRWSPSWIESIYGMQRISCCWIYHPQRRLNTIEC